MSIISDVSLRDYNAASYYNCEVCLPGVVICLGLDWRLRSVTRLTRNPIRALPLLTFPSNPEPPIFGFTGSGDNTAPP